MIGKSMQPWSGGLYLTVKLTDTVMPKFDPLGFANLLKLTDTVMPKFDPLGFAKDVEILARRLESELQRELYSGGLDVDVVTWWTRLSPRLRTVTIMTIVWIYVLGRLGTWSADYPESSKYIQDHTGITPVAVATVAAWAARAIYVWCSNNSATG